jgi:hypothetical protein
MLARFGLIQRATIARHVSPGMAGGIAVLRLANVLVRTIRLLAEARSHTVMRHEEQMNDGSGSAVYSDI